MTLRTKLKILVLTSTLAWLAALPALAQFDCNGFMKQFNITVNNQTIDTAGGMVKICSPQVLIGNVLQLLLQFSAVIAVVFLMIGGFWYLTSAGNEEQSEKGRKAITSAAIGLVVIIMAYALVKITVNLLTGSLSGGGTNTTPATTNNSTTNSNNNNATAQTPATQPTGDPNSMYSVLTASDVLDNKEHLAATANENFVSGGQGGLTAWSTIGPTDKQAILEVKAACGSQAPYILLRTVTNGQAQDYGQAPYLKMPDGSWQARYTDTKSTGAADTLTFTICQQPTFLPVPITGR